MIVHSNGQHDGSVRRPFGALERAGVAATSVLLAGLAVLGAVVSFASVEAAVEPSFGRLAWTVPIGVDVGILVFTAVDLVMGRVGMRTRWLRLIPWALVGVTIYLNVASESTLIGRVAHGVLPGLWVVAIEGGVGPVLRTWAGLVDGTAPVRMDRVRLSRWLLAPCSTLRLWRRMRLREIHSLAAAKGLHLLPGGVDQLALDLARAELEDRYGPVVWRWKAPRRQRVLYRHGALTPSPLVSADDAHLLPSLSRGVSSLGGVASRRQGTAPRPRRGGAGPVPDVSDLLEPARRVARALAAEGVPLTRDVLVARLRAEGHTVSNKRYGVLLPILQAELAGQVVGVSG